MNSPSSHSPETASDKQTLTDVLRVRTFFIVDPVVTFLARHEVSPNLLTIVGMLAHFVVAWLIAHGEMQLAGIMLILVAPLDALDGSLARKLGRQAGGFGAFLDSTLDRLAEIVLFGGFLFYYGRTGQELLMVTAYIGISGSLMVSYARARAESLGYSCRIGILSRVERYTVLTVLLLLGRPDIGLVAIATFAYITVAQRVFHVWQQTLRDE
jgi:CDP-diacylglycerol--glycerol-3-phosphate 3-phosphatidyltransferase